MDDLLDYFESILKYARKRGGSLNAESRQALGTLLSQFKSIIESVGSMEPEEPPPPLQGEEPSAEAQLLWHLSGQNENAFISYLREFPSPQTDKLLLDPRELSRVIDYLSRSKPKVNKYVVDGIKQTDLQSSNVWGTAYDKKSGKMRVLFNSGAEYEYDDVPANIHRALIKGNAAAKTDGKNTWGQWWVGKNPSVGAALNQYVKAAGFSYRRIM